MFASLLSLFTFSSLVAAGTIRRRENMAVASVKDITNVIERISNGIEQTAASIQIWKGDLNGASKIMEDVNFLTNDLDTGSRYLQRLPVLGYVESIAMIGPITKMQTLANKFATGAIAKKKMFDGASVTEQFIRAFEPSKTAGKVLARAISAKMPALVGSTIAPLATWGIVSELDKVTTAFGAPLSIASPPSYSPEELEPPSAPSPPELSPPSDPIPPEIAPPSDPWTQATPPELTPPSSPSSPDLAPSPNSSPLSWQPSPQPETQSVPQYIPNPEYKPKSKPQNIPDPKNAPRPQTSATAQPTARPAVV